MRNRHSYNQPIRYQDAYSRDCRKRKRVSGIITLSIILVACISICIIIWVTRDDREKNSDNELFSAIVSYDLESILKKQKESEISVKQSETQRIETDSQGVTTLYPEATKVYTKEELESFNLTSQKWENLDIMPATSAVQTSLPVPSYSQSLSEKFLPTMSIFYQEPTTLAKEMSLALKENPKLYKKGNKYYFNKYGIPDDQMYFYGRDTEKILVVIDPGHGKDDGGAVSIVDKSVVEKDLNLTISLQVRDELVKRGYEVIMTRDTDTRLGDKYVDWLDEAGIKDIQVDGIKYQITVEQYRDLYLRAKLANDIGADVFISIHQNSYDGKYSEQTDGVEVHYNSTYEEGYPQPRDLILSETLASDILNSITSKTKTRNRGIIDKDLAVVRETEMPACLVECGYMSNSKEVIKLQDKSFQQSIVAGIADGLDKYFSDLGDVRLEKNRK